MARSHKLFLALALVLCAATAAWSTVSITHDVVIGGDLRVSGTATFASVNGIGRSGLAQDNVQVYHIRPEQWRVWDDMDSPLPSTPANDDLGIIGGTFGTDSPSVQTEDLKAAGATNKYARCTFAVPPEYVAGETVQIVVHCGMLTTVADTSATIDVQCYESDEEAGIGADLCATAAQSCNNLVAADKTFTITATTLAAGDLLDIRITMAVNDAATGTAVTGLVGSTEVRLDIKG